MNFDGIKEDIINLIEGREITFNCGRFQNDMVSIKSKDDILCLLVCLGYLGCINPDGGNSEEEEAEDDTKDNKEDTIEQQTEETTPDEETAKVGKKTAG